MFKLKDVSKVYKVGTFGGGELRAVDSVSFDVGVGEVVSLTLEVEQDHLVACWKVFEEKPATATSG